MVIRSAILAGCAALVMACGRDDTAASGDTAVAVSDTMAGVVDSAPASVARGVAVLLSDENILAVLDTAYDVMLETDVLAQDRTDNDDVRQFASRAVTQNATAKRAIVTTAERLSVSPVLPSTAPVEGHADAMAMLRQRAGSTFDEIYLDHSLEVRKELLEKIDDAIDDEVRAQPLRQMLTELKAQLDADVKALESLIEKAG
jgi:putative membrane protein